MGEFLRSLPAAASSPYALVAYAIAALTFLFAGAKLRMAQLLMAKITAIPEAERRRALEIATGTVLPTHVSPEQWIRHSRLRWTFLLLGSLLIALLAIGTIAILKPTTAALRAIEHKLDKSAKKILNEIAPRTDLILTMVKKGHLDAESGGRVYEFTLANPIHGVAIVESVSIEVLDVIEDYYPDREAVLAKFEYRVTLQPDVRGRYTFAEGFKYASGEADKFAVLLDSSEAGYDYFFRFAVLWHDPLTNQKRESYSEVLVARYPSLELLEEVDDEFVQRKFGEHIAKVWAHRAEIAANLEAISDAQTNVTP